MNSKKPLISVVTSVYNSQDYVRQAIESILSQTYKNFEFIIVNDGSSDNTPHILSSFSDERIRVINREHRGIVPGLNIGIKAARGDLVARMDADDISLPERFEKQIKVFDRFPETDIVCGPVILMDENGEKIERLVALFHPEDISVALLADNVVMHPTVMVKKKFYEENTGYSDKYQVCEDYDLWLRTWGKAIIRSVKTPILLYRIYKREDRKGYQRKQLGNKMSLRRQLVASFKPGSSREKKLKVLLDRLPKTKRSQKQREFLSYYLLNSAVLAVMEKRFSLARPLFITALRILPFPSIIMLIRNLLRVCRDFQKFLMVNLES